jgi:hypothetical protein
VLIVILGVLADTSSVNRRLTEEMLYQLKKYGRSKLDEQVFDDD